MGTARAGGRPDGRRRGRSGHPRGLHVVVVDGMGRPLAMPGLTAWLRRIAPRSARGVMTLALASDDQVRRLNRRHRGVDRATDVLSFTARESRAHLGDVIIAKGVARRQARTAGHPPGTELRLLALHGLLHLLGFDHVQDDGRMARMERRLRRKGGLREGLIERSS